MSVFRNRSSWLAGLGLGLMVLFEPQPALCDAGCPSIRCFNQVDCDHCRCAKIRISGICVPQEVEE